MREYLKKAVPRPPEDDEAVRRTVADILKSIRERGDAGETSGNLADAQSAPYFERISFNLVRNIAASRAAAPPLPTLSVL